MKRVTIYEVAREANVSLATVSRVINGSDIVKATTKDRVERAIKKLGYKPNAIAQGLALSKTTTIGLIIPEASFTYTGQIINGLIDVAKIYNYNIMLHTITEGIVDAKKIIDIVIKSHVDGVVVYSDKISAESLHLFNNYNIPCVVIADKISDCHICSVYVDFEKAILEICSKYIANGITDIALLEDRKNRNTTELMIKGAKKAFARHDLVFDNFIDIPKDYRSSYKFLKQYFRNHRHDLVIANRDSQAMAVLNAAREHNIKVPEEMEVICVIDTKYNSMVRPKISSFSIPSYDLGAVGMRLMTKMLQDENIEDKEKCLNYLFTNRETTKDY